MLNTKKLYRTIIPSILLTASVAASAAQFTLEKRNTGFSIDGGSGGSNGRQLQLWETINHPNLTFVQLDRGNGYYSYKKLNTNYCIDGGNGGARRQPVKLWTCEENNQNQQWKKIKVESGTENYRLEKRNAPGYSIDGNNGAATRQKLYLWDSSNSNINQQWNFIRRDTGSSSSSSSSSNSAPVTIDNPGFENSFNGWNDTDPSAVSGDAHSGSHSAKITGASGRVDQQVSLNAHTDYRLSAYVLDSGTVGININGTVYDQDADSGSWHKVQVDFNSGSHTSGEIFAKYNDGTGRFDDFSLEEVGSSNSSSSSNSNNSSSSSSSTSTGSGNAVPSIITDGSLFDLEGDVSPLVNSSTLKFVPLVTQVTTPNGHGWRHEYKVKESRRTSMTSTYEDFAADVKVDMSDGGKTIVAQFHASDTGTIAKVYVSDSSESGFDDSVAGNGVFDVYVRLRNTSGDEEKYALGTIHSGDTFHLHVINNYGDVTVAAMGRSFGIPVEDNSASYFKFGNYLQSQDTSTNDDCGTPGDSDSFAQCYQELGITEATVTMTNVSYQRVED